jgi:AcrR family transcriptional regulator
MRADAPIDVRSDSGRRSARGASKQAVMRAALELIGQHGSDQVTASQIGSLAGVARSTLYGYFEDVRGILAEIWASAGRDWLVQLAEQPRSLTPPLSSVDSALLDLLAVSVRVPELRELVLPEVADLWSTVAGRRVDEVRLVWTLATAVGLGLTSSVLPEATQHLTPIWTFATFPDDAVKRYRIPPSRRPRIPDLPGVTPFSGETTADRIVHAAIQVVGQTGYHSATMLRVCRVARLTVGAAAPLFASLDEVLDRGFASMLANVVVENSRQFRELATLKTLGGGADAYAAFTASMTHPVRANWRRYRHEMYVAARTTPELASKMQTAFTALSGRFAPMLVSIGVDPKVAELLILVNQVISAGMAYVGELGLPVGTIDHRLAIRHFWTEVVDPLRG